MNGPDLAPRTGVPWHTDPPEPNRLVEVWYFVGAQLATWDGAHWHNVRWDPAAGRHPLARTDAGGGARVTDFTWLMHALWFACGALCSFVSTAAWVLWLEGRV